MRQVLQQDIGKSFKMKKYTCLFFGSGSIGKRHMGNLREVLKDGVEIIAYRHIKKQDPELGALGVKQVFNLEEAFAYNPEIAFITNPTALHMKYAILSVKRGCNIFMEKPLSNNLNGFEELEKEVRKRRLFFFIAYNLRFHPLIFNF